MSTPNGFGVESPIDALNTLIESLQAMNAQIDEELGSEETEDGGWEDAWAESARRGEYGDDWRTIQRRIDREETTLDAILTGDDTSHEAQKIRQTSRKRVEELHEQWQDDEALKSSQDELSDMAQDLQKRIENLTQQLKGL